MVEIHIFVCLFVVVFCCFTLMQEKAIGFQVICPHPLSFMCCYSNQRSVRICSLTASQVLYSDLRLYNLCKEARNLVYA